MYKDFLSILSMRIKEYRNIKTGSDLLNSKL